MREEGVGEGADPEVVTGKGGHPDQRVTPDRRADPTETPGEDHPDQGLNLGGTGEDQKVERGEEMEP